MTEEQETTIGSDGDGQDSRPHLGQARRLARRGCFAEADEQLGKAYAAGECSEAEALDLKGRICAQRGLLLQAEACWRKAQSLDPDNPAYADALTVLRQGQRPAAALFRMWGWLGVVVLLVVVTILLSAAYRAAARDRVFMARRLSALEGTMLELRAQAEAAHLAEAKAMTLLSTTADVDAAFRQSLAQMRQTVSELEDDLTRKQAELVRRQEQLAESLNRAVADSSARLQAAGLQQGETTLLRLSEVENRLNKQGEQDAARFAQSLAEAEGRIRAGQVESEAAIARLQDAIKAIQDLHSEQRRHAPVILWDCVP